MSTAARFQHLMGSALVTLQFGLIIVLAWQSLPAFVAGEAPRAAWIFAVLGTLVGLWALSANRLGNFNIRPAPLAGATLIQHGPYRWIRHPMYTAVMACGIAGAWTSKAWWAWSAVLALMVVLTIKARYEERWMLQTHCGYAAYRQRTRWFLPWIG